MPLVPDSDAISASHCLLPICLTVLLLVPHSAAAAINDSHCCCCQCETPEEWETRCAHLSQPGVYGASETLLACASAYRVGILVFTAGRGFNPDPRPIPPLCEEPLRQLVIVHHPQVHFNSSRSRADTHLPLLYSTASSSHSPPALCSNKLVTFLSLYCTYSHMHVPSVTLLS